MSALVGIGILDPKLPDQVSIQALLPTEFSTINEARQYLEVDCAQRHFKIKRTIRRGETRRDTFIRIVAEAGMWSPHDKSRSTADYIANHSALAEMCEAWFVASDKLWKRVQKSRGRDFYRMAGLRIAALYTKVTHLGLLMPQCGYDKYLDHFLEIISLAQTIMKFWEHEGSDPQKGQLDTGIFGGLMTVGLRCRHSATRREAIAILRKANRREGLNDTGALAIALDLIRSIEEGDSMVDFMPEESRVAVTGVWMDMQKRLLRATYDVCKYFPEKIEEEKTISW